MFFRQTSLFADIPWKSKWTVLVCTATRGVMSPVQRGQFVWMCGYWKTSPVYYVRLALAGGWGRRCAVGPGPPTPTTRRRPDPLGCTRCPAAGSPWSPAHGRHTDCYVAVSWTRWADTYTYIHSQVHTYIYTNNRTRTRAHIIYYLKYVLLLIK